MLRESESEASRSGRDFDQPPAARVAPRPATTAPSTPVQPQRPKPVRRPLPQTDASRTSQLRCASLLFRSHRARAYYRTAGHKRVVRVARFLALQYRRGETASVTCATALPTGNMFGAIHRPKTVDTHINSLTEIVKSHYLRRREQLVSGKQGELSAKLFTKSDFF